VSELPERATGSRGDRAEHLRVLVCTRYCDRCSGGGLISLPRCPVSPYHERLRRIGIVNSTSTSSHQSPSVASPSKPTINVSRSDAPKPAMAERQLVTRDPEEAASSLFGDMLPAAPLLARRDADRLFHDWAGSDTSALTLKRASVSECEALARKHFRQLSARSGFENIRLELNPRWQCVFVKTFYSGVVNFLLVWRYQDGCVIAHT
jgi:hypothetical protein